MCGYLAGPYKAIQKVGVRKLLTIQKHRGEDGYGAIALFLDGSSAHVKNMEAKPVIKWINKQKGDPYIIVHHRATSVGGTKLKLAHPLIKNSTILMQNGTNKAPYNLIDEAESDSEALAVLADMMPPEDLDFYFLDRTGVVIFRKNNKFYLHRDDARPLHEHSSGLMCSEPLITGEWREVLPGFYSTSNKEGKLDGLSYGDFVEVTDIDDVALCSSCKKRQIVPDGFKVCNACVVAGVPQQKEYVRPTRADIYDDYDDYDDYYNNWEGPRNSEIGFKDKKSMPVFRITPTKVVTGSHKYIEKSGIPIKLGDNYYLVEGTNQDIKIKFVVTEHQMSMEDIYYHKGGYLPLSNEAPKKVTLASLSAYWSGITKSYDLQNRVYYLTPDMLGEADIKILVFDGWLGQYIIPDDYDYLPETYLSWC